MSPTLAPEREKQSLGEESHDADFWAEVETAFQHSCQWGVDPGEGSHKMPDCDRPATWILQSKHSQVSCPAPEMFLCDEHAEKILKYWEEVLKLKPPAMCQDCKVVLTGVIKDVLHAIKL